jgi:hypothetical protein
MDLALNQIMTGMLTPYFVAKWRIPMGESGILNSFLAILATEGVRQPFMIHVLRLIGNSCADTGKIIPLTLKTTC